MICEICKVCYLHVPRTLVPSIRDRRLVSFSLSRSPSFFFFFPFPALLHPHTSLRRPLRLLLALLLLQLLALPHRLLHLGLHALGPLPRLVHVAALHDALHNLARVHVAEGVLPDLPVDAHLLGRRVRVVRERDEGRRPVVHGVGRAPRQRRQVRLCGREWRAEDDGVDVLLLVRPA